ncbi:amino acid adenylation domain-containing protein [Hydrogenophaga sp. MI9]|uniref:amino acid adenylation domain-containing protein n=1 Tax=Hydrogenophaga sp. MI9 TaxID=3453719 RepID=UPI003EEFACAF
MFERTPAGSAIEGQWQEPSDLGELLRARVAAQPDSPAYVFLGQDLDATEVLSYAALGLASDTIARRLRALTAPGDRVLLAFDNGLEAVQLFWGCILAEVIPIPAPVPDPVHPRSSESRLRGIAADAHVALILTDDDHLAAGRAQLPDVPWLTLASLLAEPRPPAPPTAGAGARGDRAIAYLQYTSGSTSAPRGVEITHANVLAQCQALSGEVHTPHPRGLIWLPWFHDYGLVHGVIQPLYMEGTAFLMSTAQFLLRPLRWLEAIGRHRITHSGAPDFAYAACVQALARTPHWSADLTSWQLATCGAEPVRAATLDAFAEAFAPFGFHRSALAPSYGLAEAVLAVTVRKTHGPMLQIPFHAQAFERHEVQPVPAETPGARTLVGCGPALPGFRLRIVDPDTGVPCAPGRIGEIWVAGPSVGRGYWGQPQATAEQFGATLAVQEADPVHYLRTGDLGFLHLGELFIAGRCKDLIISNGRNLYPQDLEQTAEAAHPNVRAGGVMAISVDKGAREAIVLLVECRRNPAPEVVRELVDRVQRQVAIEHQVELHDIVPLRTGSLPRTSSGKPQRGAAQRLHRQGRLEPLRIPVRPPSHAAPSTTHEPDAALMETLTQLWAEVLGHEEIAPDAKFFDLGGDSLLATQLVSRLRARLGVDLPISALFDRPTVRGLAHLVASAREKPSEAPRHAIAAPTEPPGVRGPGTLVAPSYSQERMWFMHELAPDSSAYNVPLALRLQGSLDVAALRAGLARVVERHEILRTRFIRSADGVSGEVVPAPATTVDEVWLTTGASSASGDLLHQQLARFTSIPFQLDRCPLFRAQVIHTAEQEAVLLIVMHHIISDQWSFAELGRELALHYNAILAGGQASLPGLPIQYADYAAWHRRWFEGERRANELAYWSRRLEGLEPLPLNNDFPRPAAQSFRGGALRFPLDPDHIAALRGLGAAHDASLSMVLIAALNVLLHRHTGKTDIGIGVPIANRHHLASENLIGTFVNTLVFRTALDGDPDFRTVLSRVRETSLDAFTHQDMPFELLVRELASKADSGRPPLFNVMFNMVNSQARDCHFDGLSWSRLDFDRTSTQFDLTFVVDTLYDHAIVIEYATDLFAPETIQRMGEHLERILRAAVGHPETRIATLPLPGDAERDRLSQWSHGPAGVPAARSVVEWVAQGLQISAQQAALVFDTVRLTHQELDQASNRLARLLRQRGIARGTRVGVCLPRSHDLVVALLAILKTGSAYVPLDPDHPAQRLTRQIEDANLALLVTHSAVVLACGQLPRLQVDLDGARIAASAADPLPADPLLDARPEDPAYLIYTSGSTGQPKGVAVPHRAVVNLLASMADTPGFTAQDRLLAVTTPSFDIAALELFLPLGTGGTVVVASEAQAADGGALAEVMAREKITVLQATPSRWHLLLGAGWAGDPQLKALVGGETLAPDLASRLLARCGEVWNMYGPTETTVWSSCWRVSPEAMPAIALGRPVWNTSIQVLDEHLQPCPIGVPGEICIGGAGVAIGYHHLDALTAERFVVQPDAPDPLNRRLYRTGDRGRWRHDGSLEHGGRLDDQIKLRGFRVELGEIETRLLGHPGVARAVVVLREDVPGQPRLAAYVVPHGSMPPREELREHLRRWLPDYMVPGVFVELATVPVLPNGKTNRRALPVPPSESPGSGTASVAPRNPAEATILAIWQAALQTDQLGIHDNFFDLGGHSILAVGVVNRIESTLKRPCALALLFKHPTVADLAAALAQSPAGESRDIPVAVLQPHGSEPGLFLLAGAEMYRRLAQQLDPAMPVYGVFSQTEIDLLEWPADLALPEVTVEKLATEYQALIRGIQPHGPYFLGGFSIGGPIAFEVARRLRQEGEEIGLIALLDSRLPGHGPRHLVAGVLRRLRLLRRQGVKHLLHIYRVYRHQSEHRGEPGSRRIQAYAQAIRTHKAVPSDLPVVFLQAGDDASTAPAYGWRSLAPGLAVERVPGRHMEILERPNVDVLAAALRKHLARARATVSRTAQAGQTASPHPPPVLTTCS